jgi:hypothetical protein
MSAFVRRSRLTPGAEDLARIEQIFLVDGVQRTPVTGEGTGTLMIVGEYEDGPFETPTQVFGEENQLATFGGFGYQYGTLESQNPCARVSLGELWNGNGFIKGKYLQPEALILVRVDTSVGECRFSLAASLRSLAGPFALSNGDTLSVTTDTGTAASTALAAAVATKTGTPVVEPVAITGGERIGLTIDSLPEVVITFQATDTTRALIASRINSTMGYTAVTVDGSDQFVTVGLVAGTGGSVTYRDIDTGTLALLGLNATPAAGTGNVVNAAATTSAEAANLINSAAIAAANGAAVVDVDGKVVVYRTGSTSGTISIAAGTMATTMGFTTATTITANVGDADTIAAGTRVRNAGGDEWVAMVSTAIAEGTATAPSDGTYDIKVRPALDDGTSTGATAGTVTTVVDFPTSRFVEVTNPANLAVALTEDQIDAQYQTAFDSTLDVDAISAVANHSLCARRSDAVVRMGRLNAQNASNEGNFGRKFHTRAPLSQTPTDAITAVADFRFDRVFYTYPGIQIKVSEIARIGTAGGQGFTSDGIITVGADGALAYINSVLNPEENPGQSTSLLGFVEGLEVITGLAATRQQYEAFKTAGICAPRKNRLGEYIFQSEVTTELTPGRTTQKRRKMADFIQDTIADLLYPESKKLMTDSRRAALVSQMETFLDGLLSENTPENQRIKAYSVTDTTAENPTLQANGIAVFKVEVTLLSSLDSMLVQTEIGEGVVITREV